MEDQEVLYTIVSSVYHLKNKILQEAPGEQSGQNSCGWLAEVQAEDDPSSVCGLEISFKSVPQDIDIKLISGQQQEKPGKFKHWQQMLNKIYFPFAFKLDFLRAEM